MQEEKLGRTVEEEKKKTKFTPLNVIMIKL